MKCTEIKGFQGLPIKIGGSPESLSSICSHQTNAQIQPKHDAEDRTAWTQDGSKSEIYRPVNGNTFTITTSSFAIVIKFKSL